MGEGTLWKENRISLKEKKTKPDYTHTQHTHTYTSSHTHSHFLPKETKINGALLASANQRLMFKLQTILKKLDFPG